MTLVDELKQVGKFLSHTIRDIFYSDSSILRRALITGSIVLGVALVGFGAYFGYQSYITYGEQTAYESLDSYINAYRTALHTDTQEEWQKVVDLFDLYYSPHKATKIAPLFLSLKADAQVRLHHNVEAINALQNAIETMTDSSPMLPLLKTKQALMQLDSADDAVSKAGLQQLVSLARDKQNPYNDMSLFYLGQYYWAHDQLEDAENTWHELEDMSWNDKAYSSPWVKQAKQKLKQRAA